MVKKTFYLLGALLFLLSPSLTDAQLLDFTLGEQPLRITVNPEVPGPNTSVTIKVEAYDIGNAILTWNLNGVRALTGYGANIFTFTTGRRGEIAQVSLSVAYEGKALVTREFTFAPSDVILVWESNTYTPPFYEGRSHYSAGAVLRVVAFADIREGSGVRLSDSELSFSWRRDSEYVASASGIGKSTFTFFGEQIRESERVGVTVLRGGVPVADREIEIVAESPRILFYTREGIGRIAYEKALSEGARFEELEATVVAEPYFFSARSRKDSHLSYEWLLNGEPVQAQGEPGLLTVRTSGEGEAQFDLEIQNTRTYQILQGAAAALKAVFGAAPQSQAGGFFGL